MFESSDFTNVPSDCCGVLDSMGDQVAPVIVILPHSASINSIPSTASNVAPQATNCVSVTASGTFDSIDLTQLESLEKSSYQNTSFIVREVPQGSFLVVPPLQPRDGLPLNANQRLLVQNSENFSLPKIELPRLPLSSASSSSKVPKKNKEKNPTLTFSCDKCSSVFKRKDVFTLHMRCHTGEKPFVCYICSKAFAQQSTLNAHSRVHTDEKPFSCNVCQAAFRQRGNLTVHMLQHSGKRPYRCEHCNKTFLRNSNLRLHLRMHTGDRPFKCTRCSAAFIARSALLKHELSHNTAKKIKKKKENRNLSPKPVGAPRRFPCPVCPKRFRQKVHRSVHLRTHTGELPYNCSQCDYRAAQQALLAAHRASHAAIGGSRDGPVQCSSCNYRCSSAAVLQRHEVRQHRCSSANACSSPQARLLMQRVALLQQQAEKLQQQARECRARAAQAEHSSRELMDKGERMKEEAMRRKKQLGLATESVEMQGTGLNVDNQLVGTGMENLRVGLNAVVQGSAINMDNQKSGLSMDKQSVEVNAETKRPGLS